MIMSRQNNALFLRENVNESESSAILHQKMQSILLQNSSFSKMKQVELDTGENLGRLRSDVYNPRIKCHHSQIVFRP